MQEFGFLWSYQESIDELKQKLLYITLELEQLKVKANEEMRRNNEYLKQLIQLVEISIQERDEARDQLQKMLMMNNAIPTANSTDQFIVKPTKANSSITESNSFSGTYNYPSHDSSPATGEISFLDAVGSPDLPRINMDYSTSIAFSNQPLINQYSKGLNSDMVIDNLARGKNLPQKGKFLEAVNDAGPLLQNLLVAGALPKWHNPPQFASAEGCDTDEINMKSGVKKSSFASQPAHAENSCDFSQILLLPSVMNQTNGPGGSYVGGDS